MAQFFSSSNASSVYPGAHVQHLVSRLRVIALRRNNQSGKWGDLVDFRKFVSQSFFLNQ